MLHHVLQRLRARRPAPLAVSYPAGPDIYDKLRLDARLAAAAR